MQLFGINEEILEVFKVLDNFLDNFEFHFRQVVLHSVHNHRYTQRGHYLQIAKCLAVGHDDLQVLGGNKERDCVRIWVLLELVFDRPTHKSDLLGYLKIIAFL